MKQIVTIKLNGVPISVEVDTGSPVFLMSLTTYKKYFKSIKLKPYNRRLYTADNRGLEIIGSFTAKIASNVNEGEVEVVVSGNSQSIPLLGEPALDILFPGWRRTFTVNSLNIDADNFSKFINLKYPNLFDGNFLTPIKNFVIDLKLKEGATPIFAGARPVPYAMRMRVEKELRGMVEKGILSPVKFSRWASPLVIVQKPNSDLRICIDPKRTLNPSLIDDFYPIPNLEDLYVEVGGHELYSVVDLTGAFQQLKLSEQSCELVTINTHIGLFKFLRLPFGVKVASAAFQRVIDQILKRLPWAKAYIDDIIITARSVDEMRNKLEQLFDLLHEYGAKVNLQKCIFFKEKIDFLGHVISKEGVFASNAKIEAVVSAKHPQNVKELQTFIGLITYLHRFVPKLSEKLSPLFALLVKDKQFVWGSDQQKSFEAIKAEISKGKFLAHFDQQKDLFLCTDASDLGIAGVLCHEFEKNLMPIVFKSRTLTDAERKYPILHRELLAVCYSAEKFYKYIYGRRVILYTDHQPLVPILKSGLTLPTTSTRVQRYLLRLNPYDLVPIFLPGKLNVLADFPSRFPLGDAQSDEDRAEECGVLSVNCVVDAQVVDLGRLKVATEKDPVFVKLVKAILCGFPEKLCPDLRQFSAVKNQLEFMDGLVIFEGRVVVPAELRPAVLKMLHEHHLGIVRSKQLARRYFYWPGLNTELERMIRSCDSCAEMDADKRPKILVPWPTPQQPFERVHLDFFDAFSRKFFLLVDAFSRWTEVVPMAKTDAGHVISVLKKIFLTFGRPRLIVADNGPPFNSKEFRDYCNESSIKFLNSPPYHPASNGVCERWVQNAKNLFKKIMGSTYSESRLQEVLIALRTSPTTKDDLVPSHVIFSYKPRTVFEDCLPKAIGGERFVDDCDVPAYRQFEVGDGVWVLANSGPRVRGVVLEKLGHVLYRVEVNGTTRSVHANQLKKCAESTSSEKTKLQVDVPIPLHRVLPKRNRKPPARYSS